MKQIKFELKNNFPELNYICPILNRLIIQGNKHSVSIQHTKDVYFVRINVIKPDKSFIKIKRDLCEATVTEELYKRIAEICDYDIPVFSTDAIGSVICIDFYESYSKIPKLMDLKPLPIKNKVDITSLEDMSFYMSMELKNPYPELGQLTGIMNLILENIIYVGMRVKQKGNSKLLEIHFMYNPSDKRASLTVGFDIVSSSIDAMSITQFNTYFATSENCDSKFSTVVDATNKMKLVFKSVEISNK